MMTAFEHLIFTTICIGLCGAAIPSAKKSSDLQTKWLTLDGKPTLLMGHRGEDVLMPEHTLGSYEFAILEGADYIEADLMMTKDGVLVGYHDVNLNEATNVADLPQFANLQRNFSEVLGNKNVTISNGWFIADFTFAQLRELRVKQKDVGVRPQFFNSIFQISSFEEYLDVVITMSLKLNKTIDIVPELKYPEYHNALHSSEGPHYMEETILRVLKLYGYPTTDQSSAGCSIPTSRLDQKVKCGHVIIICFEKKALQYLHNVSNIDLMMLVDDDYYFLTYDGLDEISHFAKYYSVWMKYLYVGVGNYIIEHPGDSEPYKSRLIPHDKFVEEAHRRHMYMGIFIVYDSREDGNKMKEMEYMFDKGLDFMFVENVIEVREMRQSYDCRIRNSNSSAAKLSFSVLNVVTFVLYFLYSM